MLRSKALEAREGQRGAAGTPTGSDAPVCRLGSGSQSTRQVSGVTGRHGAGRRETATSAAHAASSAAPAGCGARQPRLRPARLPLLQYAAHGNGALNGCSMWLLVATQFVACNTMPATP